MKYFIILISMIFCHIVDDYYLQGWLASAKQKSWWEKNAPDDLYKHDYMMALFMHSFSWTFMMMLAPTLYVIIFGGHYYDTSKRLRQEIESMYYGLELPTRATKFSAGFDIRTPFSFTLKPGEVIKIPTGIKCRMNTDYVLMIYPRSGLGFKYQCNLVNGTGIIDCDFINSDNEGHIFIKLVNRGDKEFSVTSNAAIAQGIFLEYGITEDDHVEATRNGGFGSTDN